MINLAIKTFILLIIIWFLIYLIRKYQSMLIYQNGQDFERKISNNPVNFRSPRELYLNYNDIYINTIDNVELHGWFVKTKENSHLKPTIIFFHENAGNIGFRMPLIKNYINIVDSNFIIVAYRGYSYSKGEPSELGLKIDGISIIQNILKRHNEIDINKVFIHGSSLGGAVSIFTLFQNNYLNNNNKILNLPKIRGLIIQNSFTSLSDMVDYFYPILKPFKSILLSNHWDSLKCINSIEIPTLFLSSRNDEIVPHNMMDKLFENSGSNKKKIIFLKNSSHNILSTEDRALVFKNIKNFVDSNLN